MKLNKKPFILALVVAAGIAAVATTRVRASVDTQLLALMPPDSQILVGTRIDQGVSSPIGQLILSRIPRDGGLEELKDKTGLDLRTDLREVVFSPVAKLVAARGTFPVSRLEDFLKTGDHSFDTYRGIRTVGDATTSAAFLDGSTAVAGPPNAVRQAIDRWIAHAQAPENEMMSKVAEVSATSQAWFAATDVAALQTLIGPQQNAGADIARNVLNKIATVSGQLTLPQNGGVSVEGQLRATSAEDAQTLVDAYQAFKLLAPSEAANHPLFNRAQINLTGSTINLGFAMTQQEAETILH